MKKTFLVLCAVLITSFAYTQTSQDFNILGFKLGMSQESALEQLSKYGFVEEQVLEKNTVSVDQNIDNMTIFADQLVTNIKLNFLSGKVQEITLELSKCQAHEKRAILDNLASKYNLLVLSRGLRNNSQDADMDIYVNKAVIDFEMKDSKGLTYFTAQDLSQKRIYHYFNENDITENKNDIAFKNLLKK